MLTYRLADWGVPVWRSPGVLQLGLQPGAPIISDAPSGALDAMLAMRDPRTMAEVLGLVPGLSAAWLQSAINALQSAGAILTSGAEAAEDVLLAGSGPLLNDICQLLSSEQVRLSWLRDSGTRRPTGVRTRVVDPWEAAAERPRLVLVVPETLEHDRALSDMLVREGLAHLIVRSENDRVVVGPLVVPGLLPCSRCIDLHRRDLDVSWPYLLAQLALRPSRTPQSLRWWAASTAVSHALTLLHGDLPDSAGRTIELGLPPAQTAVREWNHHRACGCTQRWSATMPSTASA